jgi:hypothetical protein
MRVKSLRNVLKITTAATIALIAGVGAWAWLGNSRDVPALDHPIRGQLPATEVVSSPSSEAKKFDGLWDLALQGPREIRRPEPIQPTIVPQVAPNFGIKLVGTVIDPKQTLGLFRDDRGAFDLKGAGQPLDLMPAGAKVASVESEIATLVYDGREVRLELASAAAPVSQVQGVGAGIQSKSSSVPPDQNTALAAEPAPYGMMAPMNPGDAVSPGEEDIFAPLPAHMDPTLPMSVPPPPAPSLEIKP